MAKPSSTALVPSSPVFGPVLFHDDVGAEGEALARRYQLWDALDGRRDLLGAAPDPMLVVEMRRQLVSGVDFAFAGIDAGWRIVPGVRLERFIHSAWLDGFALPKTAFTLPNSAEEFAEAFGARTGISLGCAELFQRVYRITPLALGEVAMRVRDSESAPWPTFRLLLSREYGLLEKRGLPAVLTQPPRTAKWFNRGAIDGFKLLDEVEREALVSMDLTRLARAGTLAELRRMLADDSEPQLRERIAASPDLRRLLAYALIQTDALAGFDTSDRLLGPEHSEHPASWFTAARTGIVTAATGDVAAMLGERGSGWRELLIAAFASPADGRTNPLNNAPTSFWGFDNLILNRMARSMLGAEYRGGMRGIPGAGAADTNEDRSQLAQLILAHVDPDQAARVADRGVAHQRARTGASDASLTNIQKHAQGYSTYMLPEPDRLGSGPRFSGTAWSHRAADARFWRMIFGRDSQLFVQFRLEPHEAAALNNALRRVRALFPAAFGQHGSPEIAVRAACDLACGVSALSTNRRFVAALRDLLDVLGDMGIEREADFRKAKHRLAKGSAGFLKARRKKGQPSAAHSRSKGLSRASRKDGGSVRQASIAADGDG